MFPCRVRIIPQIRRGQRSLIKNLFHDVVRTRKHAHDFGGIAAFIRRQSECGQQVLLFIIRKSGDFFASDPDSRVDDE